MRLGQEIKSEYRLRRVLGRTPDQWEPGHDPEYDSEGNRSDKSSPIRSYYGRSHLLNGETFIDGPFDGWECAHSLDKTFEVTWWNDPTPVDGLVVAKTRCQWGDIVGGGMTGGGLLGEPEWEDPYFARAGEFAAVFVAVELGSVRNFVMVKS